jgi:hypothetical protein
LLSFIQIIFNFVHRVFIFLYVCSFQIQFLPIQIVLKLLLKYCLLFSVEVQWWLMKTDVGADRRWWLRVRALKELQAFEWIRISFQSHKGLRRNLLIRFMCRIWFEGLWWLLLWNLYILNSASILSTDFRLINNIDYAQKTNGLCNFLTLILVIRNYDIFNSREIKKSLFLVNKSEWTIKWK